MGLLLSILVTCVGVVELLAFYHNVRRRVVYQPTESKLTEVHDQYLKDLEGVRDRLVSQLDNLTEHQSDVAVPRSIPTLRLNSSEDIDIEFNGKVVTKSRSPTPKLFQKFDNSAALEDQQALQGIKKSKAQECLPEYLVEEQNLPDTTRYILKDDDAIPPPLSEQDVFRKKMGHSIVEVDGELYYRRSPSPFPSFEITAPRNSICTELLNESAIVNEVDELSRSNSHSPVNIEPTYAEINNNSEKVSIMLKGSTSIHSSIEFWDSRPFVENRKKSKSKSPSPMLQHENERRRSLSESNCIGLTLDIPNVFKTTSTFKPSKEDNNNNSESSDEEFMEVQTYTEDMKNSLDGIGTQKGCIKKKYIRRKRIKNRSNSSNKLSFIKSNNENGSAGITIESNSSKDSLPYTKNISGNTNGPKPGEPFWVNR